MQKMIMYQTRIKAIKMERSKNIFLCTISQRHQVGQKFSGEEDGGVKATEFVILHFKMMAEMEIGYLGVIT